jgi:hypothetical protein
MPENEDDWEANTIFPWVRLESVDKPEYNHVTEGLRRGSVEIREGKYFPVWVIVDLEPYIIKENLSNECKTLDFKITEMFIKTIKERKYDSLETVCMRTGYEIPGELSVPNSLSGWIHVTHIGMI